MLIQFEHLFIFCLILQSLDGVYTLQYLVGDYLTNPNEKNPNGDQYPSKIVDEFLKKEGYNSRRGRAMRFPEDPLVTRKKLLEGFVRSRQSRVEYKRALEGREIFSDSSSSNLFLPPDIEATIKTSSAKNSSMPVVSHRTPDVSSPCSSPLTPQRLCRTRFNTTAPMYGVSLTSGKPVTIVQKFPDLLQQVIFEVCTSNTCDVVHGECVQTYMPYLFLVIPLGPVTLTGQDYVLVESGCVCRPKYAEAGVMPNPLDAIGLGAF